MIPYSTVDEAVRIANDSPYGLSGAVWANDVDEGLAVARKIRTDTFSINGAYADLSAPFGRFTQSGIGREFGSEGLDHYVELKAVYVRPGSPLDMFRSLKLPVG